jgi:hypothetical protein
MIWQLAHGSSVLHFMPRRVQGKQASFVIKVLRSSNVSGGSDDDMFA